jgi:AbrB family looped-hinge helix DNA binding protein
VSATTISSRFEILIPKHIRESMGIAPGHQFKIDQVGGRIELSPVHPTKTSGTAPDRNR